jgi:ligand-binding sensor domain-containing protein/signal transduction histidine kinase/DNA-binding response OmpR family regulator
MTREKNNKMNFLRFFVFSCIVLFSNIFIHGQVTYDTKNSTRESIVFSHVTPEDGLPTPTLTAVIQDEQGFLWFATENGLCRFDAYNFKYFQHDPTDSNSISNNFVNCLLDDGEGNIWIGTNYGLNVLNKYTGEIHKYYSIDGEPESLLGNKIKALLLDNTNRIWICTNKGINIAAGQPLTFERIVLPNQKSNWLKPKGLAKYEIPSTAIVSSNNTELWAGTFGYGLFSINMQDFSAKQYLFGESKENNIIQKIYKDGDVLLLLTGMNKSIPFSIEDKKITDHFLSGKSGILSICKDNIGRYWLGKTRELQVFDPKSDHWQIYNSNPQNTFSISEGHIDEIFKDKDGNMWLLNRGKGLDVYYPSKNSFMANYHQTNKNGYMDFGKTLFVDSNGDFWFGTFGNGLVKYDSNLRKEKRFSRDGNGKQYLTGNFIWTIHEDDNKRLWIGTDNGISIYNLREGRFTTSITKENTSLTHDIIYDVLIDSRGSAWIATQEGLDKLDTLTGNIQHITEEQGLCHYKVSTLFEDSKKNIWMGTFNGLSKYNPKSNRFKNFFHQPDRSNTLSSNRIRAIIEDRDGYIWLGTLNGLNRLNPDNDSIFHVLEKNGLLNNRVSEIQLGPDNQLYVLTSMGLSIYNTKNGNIVNYSKKDGLDIANSDMFIDNQQVYLAGSNTGFYMFDTRDIKFNSNIPEVYITGIKVNNSKLNNTVFYHRHAKKYTFNHKQSSLEFNFTVLNYVSPEKNNYAYMLEGFDEGWQNAEAERRFAIYKNLQPGEYSFRVKGTNNDGVLSKNEAIVPFEIMPPWWKSNWAILFYISMIALLIFLFHYVSKKIENSRIISEKAILQHDADEAKLKLFTEISHEFRTPLTLISVPIENMLNKKGLDKESTGELNMVKKNVYRLQNLVNKIIDYRKIGKKVYYLRPSPIDIIDYQKSIYELFLPLAGKKKIEYTWTSNRDRFNCNIDTDVIDKIMFNLLSNAFKNTGEKGLIDLEIVVSESTGEDYSFPVKGVMTIRIKNSGFGIPDYHVDKIFNRFYQVPSDSPDKEGSSGIGLSLVKDYVELLEGKISVNSKQNESTCFEVILPLVSSGEQELEHKKPSLDRNGLEAETGIFLEDSIQKGGEQVDIERGSWEKKKMHIIDDNPDLRLVIKNMFDKDFTVTESVNGLQAIEKVKDELPDIIISDIRMPKMDGNQFCKLVKNDFLTAHIPVVLLTAKAGDKNEIIGYNTGADAYITKPFSPDKLKSLVYSIMNNRERLKEMYASKDFENAQVAFSSPKDKSFIDTVNDKLKYEISNDQFSVKDLAKELGISNTQIHRKFTALVNMGPGEYIRLYRLKTAESMLKNTKLTVSEISYRCGFKHPSNFTKIFQSHYKKSPTEYRKKKI